MGDTNEFKDGETLGEMKSDIKTLMVTCSRIESSLARGGERMQNLEKDQAICHETNAVLLESVSNIKADLKENIKVDILDLKDTRSKMSWAIVFSYITGIATKFWK